MTEKNRKLLRSRLEKSAKRLVKLLEIDAPASVIANEMTLLIERSTMAYGPIVLACFARSLTAKLRSCCGMCRVCAAEIPPTTDVCERCDAKEDEAETILDAET